jgi:hypothetical protein
MFTDAKLLGVSLRPQHRRRVLVVSTFLVLVVFVSTPLIGFALHGAKSNEDRLDPFAVTFVILIFITVCRGVFGAFVQQQIFPEYREGTGRGILPGLGSTRPLRPEDREPDEFEVAIRNDAHYKAYRVITLVTLVVVAILLVVANSGLAAAHVLMLSLGLLLVGTTLILPQAIILWEQPDMPEEA